MEQSIVGDENVLLNEVRDARQTRLPVSHVRTSMSME